jgi:hypothetical protein
MMVATTMMRASIMIDSASSEEHRAGERAAPGDDEPTPECFSAAS